MHSESWKGENIETNSQPAGSSQWRVLDVLQDSEIWGIQVKGKHGVAPASVLMIPQYRRNSKQAEMVFGA